MIRGTDHFGHREAAGIVVDLFWDRRNLHGEFRVEVTDRRDGTRFVLYPATGREAIQAFHHPFSYQSASGRRKGTSPDEVLPACGSAGAGTRKGRNVARDPRCSVAVSIRDADVVIEGDAARVTEPGAVARIAQAWADNGWPAEPDESGSGITASFNAPSQGPPPWNVYRIEARSATVVSATEPGGLTRFRF